jgi:putative ABC transport system permease protein
VFLSRAAADALGVKTGEPLRVQAGAQEVTLKVAGDLPGAGDGRRLAVMDIAAAQTLFGKLGRLSRIDLRLKDGVDVEAARRSLQAELPDGVLVETPAAEADGRPTCRRPIAST